VTQVIATLLAALVLAGIVYLVAAAAMVDLTAVMGG